MGIYIDVIYERCTTCAMMSTCTKKAGVSTDYNRICVRVFYRVELCIWKLDLEHDRPIYMSRPPDCLEDPKETKNHIPTIQQQGH